MSIPQKFKKFCFIFSVTVALVGFFVLIGWIGNISFLKSISPDWISMKANAAICFLLAGITLILVNREKKNATVKWIASLFSVIIFITGTVTLLEYIFGFNTGIDELLFKDEGGAYAGLPPGRQSPTSAVYFMLFGFCYLPGTNKLMKTPLFQMLHIASGIIILAALMSYVLGSYIIAGVSLKFIFVIHSTFSFLLLILAVLFSQPEVGIMRQVSSDTSGGKIIRKTFPLFVLIFIVIGWLRFKGEQAGLYNEVLGISAFVIVMILIMGYLIFSSAISFTKSEEVLKQSEENLIRANESLELAEQQANLGNWEFEVRSQFIHWSKQMFRLFELEPAEKAPSNEEFLELIHPDDRAPIMMVFDKLLEQNAKEDIVFRTNPKKNPLKYLHPTWNVVNDDKGRPVKFFGTLQDITERIEARKALKQREELFSKSFHSKVFGLAIVNHERQVVDINETMASLIEYSREEMIGKTSLEIGMTDPVYIKKRDELLLLLLQKGNIENYELDLVTRNGKKLSLLLSVEPLQLSEEQQWLIYLMDVTEKRISEKKLEEAEAKFRNLVEQSMVGVYIVQDEKIVYVNPRALEIFGYSLQDLSGPLPVTNIINEKDKELVLNNLRSRIENKVQSIHYEFLGKKKNGEVVPVEVFGSRTIYMGKPAIIGSLIDISERKKAEEELQKSEQQFRSLFEQATDCVLLCGTDASIIKVNSSGSVISGYSTEELLRMNATELFFEEDIKQNPLRIQELLDGKSVLNDRRLKKKDGTSTIVEINTKMMADGRLLSIVRDISERKKAEQLLAESEQRLSRAELMGSLGHGYYNVKNGTMHLSEGLYKIFGVTPETFSHTIDGLRSVIHPDDFLIQQEAVETMFEKGEVEVEFRIVRPAGEVSNVLFKTRLSKNEKGELIDSFTTALCVTDRKKAEKEKSRLSDILQKSIDEIYMFNAETFHFEYANDGALRNLGYTAEELYALTPLDVKPNLTPDGVQKLITPLLKKEKEKIIFETTHKRKNGTLYPVEVHLQLIEQQNSKIFVTITRDITERKKAEAELFLSEQKYRLLFYNNPLPMWMVTIPGLDIIEVNDSAIQQYGYTREEFLKMNTIELRPAEDVENFLKEIGKMDPAVINTRTWRHKKKDGTIIQVETHSHQIMYEGRPVWLGLSNDVTERYKAKELLQKSYEDIRQLASNLQKIREDERTNIAREIHDELGQQLTGLKMDLHWLTGKIKSKDALVTGKMKDSIELINATIASVRKIATNLRPSILDDLGLISALEWQSEEFEKRSGTQVKFINKTGDLPVRPEMATAIFRIYQELLTNIARHANAELVTASLYIDEKTLYFTIKDNGVGFNTDMISNKKTLGLLGIKERTLLMGGTYEIKTHPGEGAETIISVPL